MGRKVFRRAKLDMSMKLEMKYMMITRVRVVIVMI